MVIPYRLRCLRRSSRHRGPVWRSCQAVLWTTGSSGAGVTPRPRTPTPRHPAQKECVGAVPTSGGDGGDGGDGGAGRAERRITQGRDNNHRASKRPRGQSATRGARRPLEPHPSIAAPPRPRLRAAEARPEPPAPPPARSPSHPYLPPQSNPVHPIPTRTSRCPPPTTAAPPPPRGRRMAAPSPSGARAPVGPSIGRVSPTLPPATSRARPLAFRGGTVPGIEGLAQSLSAS